MFADNLTDIMREYGITQRELAEDAHLSKSTINRYINKQQIPNIRAVINIAYALNISIDELVDFEELID